MDQAEASKFLSKMGFGSDETETSGAVGKDAADLLKAEFAKPRTDYLPRTRNLYNSYDGNGRRNTSHRSVFWADLIQADDQLRQRMVFALSQMWVISDRNMGDRPMAMASYMDTLSKHAFGNYRDLMEEITYHPAMGRYLTYVDNRKGDPRTGRTPDENYAREIMQLFTIGLVQLNMDGTPKTDAQGNALETYTNEDIVGLARVFTGLRFKRNAENRVDNSSYETPMIIDEGRHETLEKSFLGTTIPEGTATAASIDQALDALFEHPNTAPFVARQMIQRFTASNPAPAYVQRVAEAFAAGTFTSPDGTVFGDGRRGDMQALIASILLDESQHRDGDTIRDTTDLGKVREPVLNFVQWARAFDVQPVTPENEWTLLYNAGDSSENFGMMPMSSPSVFNWYRPNFVATGTESGDLGYTVPEFQVLLAGNRTGYAKEMTEYVFDNTYGPNRNASSFKPDYADEIALVNDSAALADHLDDYLLGGRMKPETRRAIVDGVPAIPVRTDKVENTNADEFKRAAYAITVVVTSPEYMVR